MRKPTIFATLLVLALLFVSREPLQLRAAAPSASSTNIAVHFSPKGGCTDAVVAELTKARTTIDIQAYSFTSTPIAKAITEAQGRGVKIRVVLDKSNQTDRYSAATFLLNAKVPVWIDSQHAIAHNKIILIDGKTILTGSFNFTKQAEESNAENLLVISGNSELSAAYSKNFAEHLDHSEKYTGPTK